MSKVIARKKRVNRNVEIGAVHRKAPPYVPIYSETSPLWSLM